jgi:protein-S-isoprenylcysteine O-methyltransferase Ste14
MKRWARALLGIAQLQLIMGALLFGPAWSFAYGEGWLYWATFGACALAVSVYFLVHDPAFIDRRLKAGARAETRTSQKIIQGLASLAFCATFALGGLEHHFHGPRWSLPVVIAGLALVVLGFAAVFLVFQENRHASATITVESEQKVIDTGPYALVRHPMYAGAMVLLLGTPLGLASPWSFGAVVLLIAVIVARLLDEEKYLVEALPGYKEYRRRVRHRLVPGVW